MDIDSRGCIRNTTLSRADCLPRLFEAIVNSIYSIEDVGGTCGVIDIHIERDRSRSTLYAENQTIAAFPIADFVVRYNGAGITDKNFKSFLTSDSTHNVSRGGKGVGRLLWLKDFDLSLAPGNP